MLRNNVHGHYSAVINFCVREHNDIIHKFDTLVGFVCWEAVLINNAINLCAATSDSNTQCQRISSLRLLPPRVPGNYFQCSMLNPTFLQCANLKTLVILIILKVGLENNG